MVMKNEDILERITSDEGLEILLQLADMDKNIENIIVELAEDIFRDVDPEALCDDVFFELDDISYTDLIESGSPIDDQYVSPSEMAVRLVGEALDPFDVEMKRLIDLNMDEESKLYCMGVLKGIYRYGKESNSDFKDWIVEVPEEFFREFLDKWAKGRNDEDKKEMIEFIEKECPEWASWALHSL